MRKMGNENLAWAAGFFDGEGYVGVRTTGVPYKRKDGSLGKQYKALRMCVTQTGDYAIGMLQRFQDSVCGLGKIRGPIKVRANWSPRYEWNCDGKEKCMIVLGLLQPWLSRRKLEQAWNALARLELILREQK
jgi:hypothetical protein